MTRTAAPLPQVQEAPKAAVAEEEEAAGGQAEQEEQAPVPVEAGKVGEEAPPAAERAAWGAAPHQVPLGAVPTQAWGGVPSQASAGVPTQAWGRMPTQVPWRGAPSQAWGGVPSQAYGGVPSQLPPGMQLVIPQADFAGRALPPQSAAWMQGVDARVDSTAARGWGGSGPRQQQVWAAAGPQQQQVWAAAGQPQQVPYAVGSAAPLPLGALRRQPLVASAVQEGVAASAGWGGSMGLAPMVSSFGHVVGRWLSAAQGAASGSQVPPRERYTPSRIPEFPGTCKITSPKQVWSVGGIGSCSHDFLGCCFLICVDAVGGPESLERPAAA